MSKAVLNAACLLSLGICVVSCAARSSASTITESFFYYPNRDIVASQKTGLLPQQLGSSINYTNVACGIGGVRIVFDDNIVDNFSFRTGNTVDTTNWKALQSPTETTVHDHEATIVWTSNPVTNGWLEVTYNPANLVLYFGNLVGDASFDGTTSPRDALEFLNIVEQPVTMETEALDINCDGLISNDDLQIVLDTLNGPDSKTLVMGPFSPLPVPEPSTLLLLGSGLFGLLAFRKKLFRTSSRRKNQTP